MLSKRIRVMATAGLVAVVAGVCAGAGVLIYQSTNRQGSGAAAAAVADQRLLSDLFPAAKTFAHYPFLNYVRTKELSLGVIADVKKYAEDGTKGFASDTARIGELVFANALANAKYWGNWSKYQASPGAFTVRTRVQRVADGELYMAAGLTDAAGATWYDLGRVVL